MDKAEALRIMYSCAQEYNIKLLNNNLLFVFGSPKHSCCFEATFLSRNFLHLTGITPAGKILSQTSKAFLRMLLSNSITTNDFELDSDGLAERKLLALPQLMKIGETAKMVGDFNSTRPLLRTEKMAGGVHACMGFIKNEGRYYFPNTVIQDDIRNLTRSPQQRVLAVLKKPITQDKYQELCYLAKNVKFEDIVLPAEVKEKVALP